MAVGNENMIDEVTLRVTATFLFVIQGVCSLKNVIIEIYKVIILPLILN